MKTLGADEKQKKEKAEVLLIIRKVRAKSVNDEYGKVYFPGDQETFKGTAKLQLLAMKYATRELNTPVERDELKPELKKMTGAELDEFAKDKYKIDISKLRRKDEKIKAIKSAELDS